MDSVRFGRTLGIGARLAARTLVTAVDAATAPNPNAPRTQSPIRTPTPTPTQAQTRTEPSRTSQPRPIATQAAGTASARTATQLRETTRGLAGGSRRFKEAAWGPVVRLSGVLWLEFTGVFFGIFALFAGLAAWKLRGNLHPAAGSSDARAHLLLAIGMTVVFGYFCLSSFVRASRRGRRR